MTKTSLNVIERAHRHIGVLSVDETATADMQAYGLESLNAAFDELQSVHGTGFTWDIDTVPDAVFEPLSVLLAATIAPHYALAAPVPRASALMRVRAFAFPNDIEDRRDTDEDGIISEAEEAAGLEAQFF